jgi:hypothetical protein
VLPGHDVDVIGIDPLQGSNPSVLRFGAPWASKELGRCTMGTIAQSAPKANRSAALLPLSGCAGSNHRGASLADMAAFRHRQTVPPGFAQMMRRELWYDLGN